MGWSLLGGAILAEVIGTLSLRVAAGGRRPWYLLVAVAYLLAFALLSGTLAAGMPLGVAYGMWAAVGIVLTALASRVLFREALTPVMLAGMGMIAVGVLLIELGGAG
ncbi:QacE family quaternary ammonium compound efflux SMR transporter [Brachybacterium vulturis]|uniref:QacE family quaternary ammonium compound efflux SMR transporter n=1 Tax=Brachybacterium vulturis TaxID=2017484 RepID=A0A291GKZ1_9MICO|nr:SMR family transporter [Brachybacterium vulturis]ATG50624.1 QacE family quaternary ammonium compound efflux SMR transporter [Brachybacterium vulturis]